MIPLVAIVGRPNVGKSALFNRLVGKKHAIVSEEYGTTRDVLSDTIMVKKKRIEVMDMAGIISSFDHTDPLLVPVQTQAREALLQADLILFLVDGTAPLTQDDFSLADHFRQSDKHILFVITKCDHEKTEYAQSEIYTLGMQDPIFISSLHNRGITALLETIYGTLKKEGYFSRKQPEEKKDAPAISFSIVGKPNVGKSSLFNQLVEKSKSVVSDIPGTTRDTVDSNIQYNNKVFRVIDTAGLKKPGRTEKGIDTFSMLRTMRAIKRSDVCLIVIDALEKISHMDKVVSHYVLEEKKGVILIVNKWDTMEHEKDIMDRFLTYLQHKFDYIPWSPVLFVSAKTGKNIDKILDQVAEVYEGRTLRVETGKLNRFIDEIVAHHAPKGTKKINPKIFYATQVETAPPHFILFVNEKEAFHFSWIRYFEKCLREKFGFAGTPLIIELRNRTRDARKKR